MNKYKSRSEVPEKYKWDLTDFFKNDKEYEKEYNKIKKDIELAKKYVGCTKNSKKLLEFIKYSMDIDVRFENLSIYAFLKNDEELGIKENIERINKIQLLYTTYSNYISFFKPEFLKLSNSDFKKIIDNKDFEEYKFMLKEIYKDKKHYLNEEEEKIINVLNTTISEKEKIYYNKLNKEHNYVNVVINRRKNNTN